jgi:hypothetical protein
MKLTKVTFSDLFINQLDRLDRKYPLIEVVVSELVEKLEAGERPGDKIPNVGYDVYKEGLKNHLRIAASGVGFVLFITCISKMKWSC